ncbi:MAG: lysozyme family protein, partial [Oscillospiraceae bacterium]|nr:lysozyme family protein [Oscillospiraceae bacterium]
ETKGERDDVMQSSESAGLEPNSLGPEASIAQACDYFRGLVDRTEDLDVDRNTLMNSRFVRFPCATTTSASAISGTCPRYICVALPLRTTSQR